VTVLAKVAAEIMTQQARMVAIDGVDGVGKTHFANELATELTHRGVPTIRASADGFHNPAAIRYRSGRGSPEGYYRDSYDYPQLIDLLLNPLREGRPHVRQIYDVHKEQRIKPVYEETPPDAILIFDGIFTHRPELITHWTYTIWLEVPFEVSIPRGAQRGYGDPDPAAESNHRYIAGQQLYTAECQPRQRATAVIDNTNLAAPILR
jgi:uridine kinase